MSTGREEICGLLKQVSLFADLSPERLRWLAGRAHDIRLADGEEFVRIGDDSTHWHIVAAGGVDWFMPVDGLVTRVAHMDAVNYLGMTGALTGERTAVAGRAAGETRLLRYDEKTLFDLVSEEHGVLREVVRQFRPNYERGEAIARQREKLAALGSLSAGLAHEINNPAAAARRAADELGRSLDVLRGGAKRLAGLDPAALERIGALACSSAHTVAGDDPLDAADREEALGDWLEEHGVPEAWSIAGELAGAGLDEEWLGAVEEAAGADHLAQVIAWAAAGATTGGLIEELMESLSRVSDLVGAIKSYSHMDQAPEQELDVHEGLENTLTILGHKVKRLGITVKRDYDRALPHITGAGGELNQVWTNLIDNAIAAAGPGGHLAVATASEDGRIRVTVADDGPGIPPGVKERIFEPFFTTKPVGEGTGLGLDVAWRIVVTNHRGELRVRSEPGDTRFEVLLPV